jgi:hypothetical protein
VCLSAEAGAAYQKPAPNDYLERWPVSKRVNSRSDIDRKSGIGSHLNPNDIATRHQIATHLANTAWMDGCGTAFGVFGKPNRISLLGTFGHQLGERDKVSSPVFGSRLTP